VTEPGDTVLAERALELVDVDPRRAWRQASGVLDRARKSRDHAVAAVAGRAAGLAALHLTDLDTAVTYLRRAVDDARHAGSGALTGEVRMSLAFVLNRRGDTGRALRTIDAALHDLKGVQRARALAQRGAIRQQLGSLDEALADYRLALPQLRRAGDWRWVARLHSNRGVLHIYRSQLTPAAAELAAAERVCREHELGLQLAFVYDNLGFLHVRRGDVPTALAAMDEAERRHTALGAQAGTVLLDRSELLLSVHLVAEGREAAARAVEEFTRLRRRISLPQAQLLLADAALLDGDVAAARAAADAAVHALRAQHRGEWLALARYTALRCRAAEPAGPPVGPAELGRAAESLAAAGWAVPALDARLRAAQVCLDRGRPAGAADLLRQAGTARLRGPAELRARAWHAEALLRLAEGHRRSASVAVATGMRILEEYQANAGASDVRSHVPGHRGDLARLGLRLALESGRPRRVLAWAERGRATALLMRPARPPDDPVLAQLLAELRATVAAVDEARWGGRPPGGPVRHQAALENAVRDRVRATGGPASASAVRRPPVEQLGAALGDAALVEYVESGGVLSAVTVVDSRARWTRLGSYLQVSALADHLRFALRRMCRGGDAAAAALRVVIGVSERLDTILLGGLRRAIGERPLALVPTGCLQSLVWSRLPSCKGRPVTVAPSAALWLRAAAAPRRGGGVVAVAGPALPAAPGEAAAVAGLYDDGQLLTGAAASVAAVRDALGTSAIAHIAAHGHLRTDNPLFSSLRLADGPLTVYDLEALGQTPRLVVLAACDGGSSAVYAGDELVGLAAGFLTMGTTALVAPLGPVSDDSTAELMLALHRGVRSGATPAAALARVQAEAADASPLACAAAASLVCFGAGDVAARVDPPPPERRMLRAAVPAANCPRRRRGDQAFAAAGSR
jgi:tetratricopeptide (TPR) repeat protein